MLNRENQDLRRWSEESAVEEDHCQCTEYQSGTDRFRGGTGAWRCDACCSCGWNLCIGGRGGCKDRESGGNRRTGSGDRRKIRDTVSEICADLSDGESVIPEAFLNTDECTDNKVMEKRAGN